MSDCTEFDKPIQPIWNIGPLEQFPEGEPISETEFEWEVIHIPIDELEAKKQYLQSIGYVVFTESDLALINENGPAK